MTNNQPQPPGQVDKRTSDKPKGFPAQKPRAPGEPARKPTKS